MVYLVFRCEQGHQAFESAHETEAEALKQARSRSNDWIGDVWTINRDQLRQCQQGSSPLVRCSWAFQTG